MWNSPKQARGFTYLELLFVGFLVLMLLAIAVPNFLEAQTRAQVSRSYANLATISNAVESYRTDHRAYPPMGNTLNPQLSDITVLTTPIAYMTRIPRFPTKSAGDPTEIPPLYVNLTQFYSQESPREHPYQGGYVLYSLSTMGPDQKDDLRLEQGAVKYEIYNPTNGTISSGDLVQFGP